MPPQSPSKKRTSSARSARSKKRASTGSRSIDVILPARTPLDALPQSSTRESRIPLLYKPPEFKRRTFKRRSFEEKQILTQEAHARVIQQLEKKWLAVCTYAKYQRYDGTIPTSQVFFSTFYF